MRPVKVSTGTAPAPAAEPGIGSIETVAILAQEREVARRAGAMRARDIVSWAVQAAAA